MRQFLSRNLEAIAWICALAWLALCDPAGGLHVTLCPLKILGADWCPGCGLGRAVSCLLHGEVAESLRHHLLGIPASLIIVARVARLTIDEYHRFIKTRLPHHSTKEPVCPM